MLPRCLLPRLSLLPDGEVALSHLHVPQDPFVAAERADRRDGTVQEEMEVRTVGSVEKFCKGTSRALRGTLRYRLEQNNLAAAVLVCFSRHLSQTNLMAARSLLVLGCIVPSCSAALLNGLLARRSVVKYASTPVPDEGK